jgi:hypothetical protein
VSGSADGDGQVRGGDAFGAGEDQAERKERIEAVWRCRIPTIPGKSNPALSSKSEPVYVRLPPRFAAIRASGEGLPPPSSWRSKIRYRGIRAPPGVEKHVARCPKCRDHLDEELGSAAAMRSPFRRYVERLIEAERKKAAKR